MTVLLELIGVSKSYGALKAVDTLSLAVNDGEALAVIGPNGAGKSRRPMGASCLAAPT
jgi:ABC-type branched-subunit amino acid transport system ATPase component